MNFQRDTSDDHIKEVLGLEKYLFSKPRDMFGKHDIKYNFV